MTIGVISIALSLPTMLAVGLNNISQLTGTWQNSARISVFLSTNTTSSEVENLRSKVGSLQGVARVNLITSQQALTEFRRLSGFKQALDALGANPLPAVLVVIPSRTRLSNIHKLTQSLNHLPKVKRVVADTHWLKRLSALLSVGRRATWILGALLALAVFLVVGNTVRLEIQGHRHEIEVQKLVGATDRFIRRPFLYFGLWAGALGGILAWGLVEIALAFISGPISNLVQLYAGSGQISGPGLLGLIVVGGSGGMLGWLGSLVVVRGHLRNIEPA